jgi:hypothetical protein
MAVSTQKKVTTALKAPSAAARAVPMMMQAKANGSVRGRAALIQMGNLPVGAEVSDIFCFITECIGIR